MLKKIIKKLNTFINLKSYSIQELIQLHGGKIGKGVFIGQDVMIDYDYSFLLEIGDGAVIAARTVIEFHDSCLPNVLGSANTKIGRVRIGSRAYIGVNSVLLPGISIGNMAIVGACSLVNRDIPAAEVWGGNPVRYISTIDELLQKRQHSDYSDILYLNWIGEPEKAVVNYQEFKKDFIKKVRLIFENRQDN